MFGSLFIATIILASGGTNSLRLGFVRNICNRNLIMSARAIPTDEQGWRTVLSPDQFAVLRQKATEPSGYSERKPGELEYELKKAHGTKYPKKGTYECVGCGTPLYSADSKFDSGCGWPAYFTGLPGAIKEVPDEDGRRTEIVCSNCGSHLGHVFKGEGFPTPTNERCVATFASFESLMDHFQALREWHMPEVHPRIGDVCVSPS